MTGVWEPLVWAQALGLGMGLVRLRAERPAPARWRSGSARCGPARVLLLVLREPGLAPLLPVPALASVATLVVTHVQVLVQMRAAPVLGLARAQTRVLVLVLVLGRAQAQVLVLGSARD